MLVSDLEGLTIPELIQFQYSLLAVWKEAKTSGSSGGTQSLPAQILAAAIRDLAADATHAGRRLVQEFESLRELVENGEHY
ncbi:hypothetical protein CC2G_006484 [Coprinopsis cinerea AmutBmut pab1-1]|nr:hypothetical protein CC2G_006484 [Coprinopsis cinerea AmutBmut pab1-1]